MKSSCVTCLVKCAESLRISARWNLRSLKRGTVGKQFLSGCFRQQQTPSVSSKFLSPFIFKQWWLEKLLGKYKDWSYWWDSTLWQPIFCVSRSLLWCQSGRNLPWLVGVIGLGPDKSVLLASLQVPPVPQGAWIAGSKRWEACSGAQHAATKQKSSFSRAGYPNRHDIANTVLQVVKKYPWNLRVAPSHSFGECWSAQSFAFLSALSL